MPRPSRDALCAAILLLSSAASLADPVPARGLVGTDSGEVDGIPLEEVSGEVFDSGTEGRSPFDPVSDETSGTFLLSAEFSGGLDVRVRPEALLLDSLNSSLDALFSERIGLRNADPATGRPRLFEATGACSSGSEPDCLLPPVSHCDHAWLNDGFGIVPNPDYDRACVFEGYGDRAFDRLCELSGPRARGALDCSLTLRGSDELAAGLTANEILGRLLAGDSLINALLSTNTDTTCNSGPPDFCTQPANKGSRLLPFGLPLVLLTSDPGDLESLGCVDLNSLSLPPVLQVPCGGTTTPINFLGVTLSPSQEGGLGCGPFFGVSCDLSGIDSRRTEVSALLQAWPIVHGLTAALDLKGMGVSPVGTEIIDPATGLAAPFRAPGEYRTDEGVQPGTLPWAAAEVGEPVCAVEHLGGDAYSSGVLQVPTGSGEQPPSRDQALPGCHRKWVDSVNGYLNSAWGTPVFLLDGSGDPILDPTTGLPLQSRDGDGNVLIDTQEQSGNPDPLGVHQAFALVYPDAVAAHSFDVDFPGQNPIFSSLRPVVGPGHPFASRRAVAPGAGPGRPQLVVSFASELAGLSWNYLILATAFSDDFRNGLETVGDLADPTRDPCGGGLTVCGANLEGGSIPQANPLNPNTIGADRREVASLLFAYCGSDYGIVNGITGLGTCRIDGNVNPVPSLERLYVAAGIDPLDLSATQAFQDSLQFVDVPLVQPVDPFDDDEFEDNPPVPGPDNILHSQHCSFITPQYCSLVREIASASDVGENFALPAVGPPTIARRHWLWETGAAHQVDRATGEFAGHGRAVAFGPFVSDADGSGLESRTPILLEEPRFEEMDLDRVNVPGDRLVSRDWHSGLDWLDVARTAGLSYDDILAGVEGWADAGWRHATTAEICAFFRKQYLPADPCPGTTEVLITGSATAQSEFVQMLAQPDFADPSTTTSGKVLGLYDDGNPADGVGLADFTARYLNSLTFITFWSVEPDDRDSTASDPGVGNFLVRPVPEPGMGLTQVAALAVIAAVARRRARRDRPAWRQAQRDESFPPAK